MNINTTINIRGDLLEELNDAAAQVGISRNRVIILLMGRVVDEKKLPVDLIHRIHYQMRDDEANWQGIHVWLPPRVYELWQDMRKFHKMSVSAIIAHAIREHLEILLQEFTDTPETVKRDKNPFQYIFAARDSGGIQKFVIWWGFPGEEELGRYLE
ncbi:MAG: hypothetical protein GY754_32635 [bacterium]|nr:hypothetical protein [bacterium]